MYIPSDVSVRHFSTTDALGIVRASVTSAEGGIAETDRYIVGARAGMACFGTDDIHPVDSFIVPVVLAVFEVQLRRPEAPYTAEIIFKKYPAVRLVIDPPTVENTGTTITVTPAMKLYIEDGLLFQNSSSTAQEIYQAVRESLSIFRKHYSL